MSTEADIVTAEMLRALVTSDHKRGCQGREYDCSCGYDDGKDAMIERAAVALEQLRAERDAAARDMRERCAKVAEDRALKLRGKAKQHRAPTTACNFAQAVELRNIAGTIRALPSAVIATSGKDAT